VIFTTCSHKITLFTTFKAQIGLSSFPQEINRPENQLYSEFERKMTCFWKNWMLEAVDNPHF
jgi:hypothetical protein